MRVSVDDRRVFYGDLFPEAGMPGDLNVVVLQPGALVAWHRHQHQEDYLFCVKGSVKVGKTVDLADANFNAMGTLGPEQKSVFPSFTVLHERHNEPCVVPPNVWHGYQNLSDGESILISYNTQHYNPGDEERRVPDENEWKRVAR